MFDAPPGEYAIADGGWCATGVAMGKKIASDPEIFSVHEGVTYLFSSAKAKAAFDEDPGATAAKASQYWPNIQ